MVQSKRGRWLCAGGSLGALALVAAFAAAEVAPSARFTVPTPPPREVLDRLNLEKGWQEYIPMDGVRDGFDSIQVLPHELLIQTRSGLILLLDAETGKTLWRSRAGIPYRNVNQPAANSTTIVFVNNVTIYGLDRATGAQAWRYRLPGGISAPPVLDEESVFLVTVAERLYNFFLPRVDLAAQGTEAEAERARINEQIRAARKGTAGVSRFTSAVESDYELPTGEQPVLVWDTVVSTWVRQAPLSTRNILMYAAADGTAVALEKVPAERSGVAERWRFQADGPIRVQPGKFQDTAYLASQDGNVHAINMNTGRVHWRFTSGQPYSIRPMVLEKDVYIASAGQGLMQIDRANGAAPWRVRRGSTVLDSNVEATRFLAANPKFVYSADGIGRLQVLDHRLGHTLSTLDTRDFVFPVANEQTDRVYLAANNGLIVCLHDKEYKVPVRHRRLEEDVASKSRKALDKLISDPGKRPLPLSSVLEHLQKYLPADVRIQLSEQAFTNAGLESPALRLVGLEKVENVPLGEVLRKVLSQVRARYEVIEDTILVVPAPRAP
jgi:outer membrane protein assembly factor BamB